MRLLRLAPAALLALILAAVSAFAEAPARPLSVNAGEARQIFTEMDEGSQALRTLSKGEAFLLEGRTGEWAKVLAYTEDGSRVEGYALADGLAEQTAADGFAFARVSPKEGERYAVLRGQAKAGAKSLGKYFPGVIARVLEQREDGWVKLGIGILEGYMRAEELQLLQAMGDTLPVLPETAVRYEDGPGLTMRAEQSFQSGKMGAYSNGTMVKVLGFTDDFAHVYGPDGKVGFMMAWGLDPQPASLSAGPASGLSTPPPDADLIAVSNPGGQGAHLRARASTDSDSLGLYKNGAQVYILSYGEYWCEVWADGRTGYMMTKLLGVQQAAPDDSTLTPGM